ncbi:putative undecaprenyl diphosphate synthase-domain-containing protein [Trichophaea hybrida]|nr:putative undecaprenyl diphosphate synthase-domain-containing protein [Trichophaea hybrida]
MRKWLLSSPPAIWASTQLQELFINSVRQGPIPQHVALVMDGNRRFAQKNHIETAEGHNMGSEALAKILEVCFKSGVKVVTVYAFSIENFKRPLHEVNALMEIVKIKLVQLCERGDLLEHYQVSLRVLGQRDLLRPDVLEVIDGAVEMTKHYERSILNFCFPYTSRHEISSSIRDTTATPGLTDFESITQETLTDHLFTAGCPPLDLLIRTSGVCRLSDFMLWQCHKDTEIVFVDCLWPQFNIWRFLPILVGWGVNRRKLEKMGVVEVRREGARKDVELNSDRQRELEERGRARVSTF